MFSSAAGYVDVVKLLLERGAGVNAKVEVSSGGVPRAVWPGARSIRSPGSARAPCRVGRGPRALDLMNQEGRMLFVRGW